MTNETMQTLARGYFDAVCAADGARLRDLFSENIRWRIPKGAIPPFGGTHEGAYKIIEMMLGENSRRASPRGSFRAVRVGMRGPRRGSSPIRRAQDTLPVA